MPLHNRTSSTEALKVHRFHLVQRLTVPEEEDISTKTLLLRHQALGLLIILSSTARRNRITVHSLLVLPPALLVLRISHTYQLLISQLAASTSQILEVKVTRHLRPTPRINLLHHRPDHSSSGMAIAFPPKLEQTLNLNTRVLPQSYLIGSNRYLHYRLPSLRLQSRPIRHLLLLLPRSHQVEMHFLQALPHQSHNHTRRESHRLETQENECLIVPPPCIINYLLYRTTHRMVVLGYHRQLSIAGLLV